MRVIFNAVASAAAFYSFLCFIRIMLTWFPNAAYSPVGRVLSRICDPFLNIFRSVSFLHHGRIDFSPVAAILLLNMITSALRQFALTGVISLAAILVLIVQLAWQIAASLLLFLIILIAIRLFVDFFMRGSRFQLWAALDQILSPILYGFTRTFSPNRMYTWRTMLLLGLGTALVLYFAVGRLIVWLVSFLAKLPF